MARKSGQLHKIVLKSTLFFTEKASSTQNKKYIMKNPKKVIVKTAATSNFRLLTIIALSLSSLTLTACQKEPEAETVVETQQQTAPVTVPVEEVVVADEVNDQNEASAAEKDIELKSLENNIGAAGATPNAQTTTPSPEQAIKGTQITDVSYRSANGENLSVVFETSATGVLNAIVTLPNKAKMTLSAPEGQGNNPTYRSKDGNVELVSHGGGSSIDLLQNGKVTSYQATSAEAEVVTQP